MEKNSLIVCGASRAHSSIYSTYMPLGAFSRDDTSIARNIPCANEHVCLSVRSIIPCDLSCTGGQTIRELGIKII